MTAPQLVTDRTEMVLVSSNNKLSSKEQQFETPKSEVSSHRDTSKNNKTPKSQTQSNIEMRKKNRNKSVDFTQMLKGSAADISFTSNGGQSSASKHLLA